MAFNLVLCGSWANIIEKPWFKIWHLLLSINRDFLEDVHSNFKQRFYVRFHSKTSLPLSIVSWSVPFLSHLLSLFLASFSNNIQFNIVIYNDTVPWLLNIYTFREWTLPFTMRLNIAIYNDRVPWLPYIPTFPQWTLMCWSVKISSPLFDVSYSTKQGSLNNVLWYDVIVGSTEHETHPLYLKQYYEMWWKSKNFTFHLFSLYIYVITLVVTVF